MCSIKEDSVLPEHLIPWSEFTVLPQMPPKRGSVNMNYSHSSAHCFYGEPLSSSRWEPWGRAGDWTGVWSGVLRTGCPILTQMTPASPWDPDLVTSITAATLQKFSRDIYLFNLQMRTHRLWGFKRLAQASQVGDREPSPWKGPAWLPLPSRKGAHTLLPGPPSLWGEH